MVVALVLLLVGHLDDAGQAEVRDSQREGDRVNQNIGGLDVPVHNPAAVDVTKRPYHLLHQVAHNVACWSRQLMIVLKRLHPHPEVDAAVREDDV